MPPEARPHPAQRLPYLFLALAFLALCALWDHFLLPGTRDLWDARVYAHAIAAFRAGSDPYSLADGGLPFVYPPIFLYLGAAFAHIPAHLAWAFYLAVLTISTLAIPWLLATQYLRTRWLTPAIALVVFVLQPRLFGEIVFLSGNLGAPLYALILIAALPGLRRNRWLWFYAAIVLASLIKPPFLTFLVLPVFLAHRQFPRPASPPLPSPWPPMPPRLASSPPSSSPSRTPSASRFSCAMTTASDTWPGSSSSISASPAFHGLIAPIAYLAVMAALLAAMLVLRRRTPTPNPALWLPMLLVFAIIANPRMQAYDAEIAFLPAIVLCVECFRLIPATPRRTALIAASLAFTTALLSRDAQAAIFLLFTASILLTLYTLARAPEPA